MSVQIFLQGKILGVEQFLLSAPPESAGGNGVPSDRLLVGRSRWVTLLSEVLPRALLAELGLARILLGSSGGGQFLVVLPSESSGQANGFLTAAARQIEEMSGGCLQLIWAITENLGDWSVVRKRLQEEMRRKRGAPASSRPDLFEPFLKVAAAPADDYFTEEMALRVREAESVGWSPEAPARIATAAGKHSWAVASSVSPDSIPLARHAAPSDDGGTPAALDTLAGRSTGRKAWGVLRGDVDNMGIRLRRLQTIEEHVQISVMYKQFFAGELEVLCSLPDFWRKASIIYSGGDDFAVYGAWDALIPLAREIQRLFRRFAAENLKDLPGPEGKTISMALAVAAGPDAGLAPVFEEAGTRLEIAKSTGKDCFHVLGRTLEWKQLGDASDMMETMTRMAAEFGVTAQSLFEMSGFYRNGPESSGKVIGRSAQRRFDKPWRFYRRLSLTLGGAKDRESQKARAELINEMAGKGAQAKLRPAGQVALEWTRLLTEG